MLALKKKVRDGAENKTRVEFLDFVIDGLSLYDELCSRGHDFVSCLGWLGESFDSEARARLLLDSAGDLPSGRVSLFICPECADLGCGSISAKIYRKDSFIIWSEIGYENNYEEQVVIKEGLGPFNFVETDYRKILAAG